MKNQNRNYRSNAGEGLVLVIIVLALIGGGVWWLYSHKATMDRDARTFGKEMIQHLTINHDLAFFRDNLGPQAKLDYPPSQQQYIISKLTEMGVPQQPINIEEQVTFESHFFEPKGYFTARLFYPSGAATMQVAVSHPVGKWQLDNLMFTPEHPH